MNKKIILVVVLLAIAASGWLVYTLARRQQLYNAEERVLLIDRASGLYTYSDIVDEQTKRQFKPINYVSRLSAERLDALLDGLNLYSNMPQQVSAPGAVALPTNPQAWAQTVAMLSPEQQGLCAQLQSGPQSQTCIMRHLSFQAVGGRIAASVCDDIFIQNLSEECAAHVAEKRVDLYVDRNSNDLLDQYEIFANPEALPEPTI